MIRRARRMRPASLVRPFLSPANFRLSSDTIAATYSRRGRPARLVNVVRRAPPDELDAFSGLASTVGAFLVFPLAACTDGKGSNSINQARGNHSRIVDRPVGKIREG